MSTTPSGPHSGGGEHSDLASTPRWIPIVFAVLFALVAYGFYDGHSSRQSLQAQLTQANQKADQLAAQLEKSNERIEGLKGELELTTQKLGLTTAQLDQARYAALSARKEEKARTEQLQAKLGQLQQENSAQMGQISTAVSGTKSDIEATRKDLEATKAKLDRTIGDMGVMSGLVAHNKEELEALKRLGERNIFEFDLRKSKSPERVGPIMVQLRKTDSKRFKYTMDVIADDRTIQKKDKTANEPVQFYVRGAHTPYEIVVFDVAKNRITGYLATPKDAATPQPAAKQ